MGDRQSTFDHSFCFSVFASIADAHWRCRAVTGRFTPVDKISAIPIFLQNGNEWLPVYAMTNTSTGCCILWHTVDQSFTPSRDKKPKKHPKTVTASTFVSALPAR